MTQSRHRLTMPHAICLLAAAIFAHGVLCSPLLDTAEAKPEPEAAANQAGVVTARAFRLVDAQGNELGRWSLAEKSKLPLFRMLGKDKQRRFEVVVEEAGTNLRILKVGEERPGIAVGRADEAIVISPGWFKLINVPKKQYGTYDAHALTFGTHARKVDSYFNSTVFKHLDASVKKSLGTEIPKIR